MIVIIHLAAVVLQTVTDHEIVYMQQHVVGGNLVENFLGNGDMRSLVFGDHSGAKFSVVEHAVGTQGLVAYSEFYLVGK